MQYVKGDRESVSECTIHSASGRAESFNPVMLPAADTKKGTGGDDKKMRRRRKHLMFATNITKNNRMLKGNVSVIPDEYRKRWWGIETGYACIEKFRPQTTSKNQSMIFLYFFYPLILFNCWIIANCMLQREMSGHVVCRRCTSYC